ncbi:MAG: hypothetical protein EAZ95_12630 [Bacteroidetes bacterium]|nr:MAG: hypothetical protein EAZ95_12630 [Bacteroidota bacterium]
MYLLEESAEGAEMRQKVYNMLVSSEKSLVELALQLIEGGGMHADFIPPVYVWALDKMKFYPVEEVIQRWLNLLVGMLPDSYLEYIRDERNNLGKWAGFVSKMQQQNAMPDLLPTLIKHIFSIKNECADICWKLCLLPKKQILTRLVTSEKELYLSILHLKELPQELAEIDVETLVLYNVPLKKLKKATWQNKNVEILYVDDNIQRHTLNLLKGYFPNFDDSIFYNIGLDLARNVSADAQRKKQLKKAKLYALRAINFLRMVGKENRDFEYYHARAHAYSNAGMHQMAFVCYEHIREVYEPDDYKTSYYNMACNYALLNNLEKMLIYLAKMMVFYPSNIRKFIMSDTDMKAYYKNKLLLFLIDKREEMDNHIFEIFVEKFIELLEKE